MNSSMPTLRPSYRLRSLVVAGLWGVVELVALWRSRFGSPTPRR